MDTLSRDSSNSGSILPLVGVIAGGLALILSIVALVKLSTAQKVLTAHEESFSKISSLENDVRASTTKSENDLKGLKDGVQGALTSVGNEIGAINQRIAKVEEAQKARPVAAAPSPKAAGSAGVVTGTVDSAGNYSVAPGDTLSKIAKKFTVRLDAIEAENPGIDPTRLRVGQKIKIPKK